MSDANQALIRQARPDEAEPLSHLALRAKAYWGYSKTFMEACRQELTLSPSYLTEHQAFVVENAQMLIGFYTLERCSDTEVELGFLFIEPVHIGCGYGRALMEHAKKQARAWGCQTMIIQGDPHAVSFYHAAGGSVVGAKASASIPGRTLPLFRIEL